MKRIALILVVSPILSAVLGAHVTVSPPTIRVDTVKVEAKLKPINKEPQREASQKKTIKTIKKASKPVKKAKKMVVAPAPKKAVRQAVVQPRSVEIIVRDAAVKHGLDPNRFVGLIRCESSLDPTRVNYNYYENGHPSGLGQHLSGYFPARAAKYGYSTNVFDAYSNANVTAAMIAEGQQGLWECPY